MRTSVVVITRNRADFIGETFQALAQQECPDFEILVVDSSTGDDREKTEKLAAQYGIKYVPEPRRGQALARNTAIAQISSEIIAFTDDDCLPAKDWLAQTVKNFSDPSVWICTGRVMQHSREGAGDLFEEVAGQDLGLTRRVFSRKDIQFDMGFLLSNVAKVFAKHMKSGAPVPWCLGHGSSMSFRREAFRQNGGFDERYGWGCPFGGCEDIEIFYRTLQSGHCLVYEPAAVIRHKHRFSAEEVFRTRYVYSYGGAAFMRVHCHNPLMFFQFVGRLVQLLIKTAQYKIMGKKNLAQSFGSDLRGFLDGWASYRKFVKESGKPSAQPVPKI